MNDFHGDPTTPSQNSDACVLSYVVWSRVASGL